MVSVDMADSRNELEIARRQGLSTGIVLQRTLIQFAIVIITTISVAWLIRDAYDRLNAPVVKASTLSPSNVPVVATALLDAVRFDHESRPNHGPYIGMLIASDNR